MTKSNYSVISSLVKEPPLKTVSNSSPDIFSRSSPLSFSSLLLSVTLFSSSSRFLISSLISFSLPRILFLIACASSSVAFAISSSSLFFSLSSSISAARISFLCAAASFLLFCLLSTEKTEHLTEKF